MPQLDFSTFAPQVIWLAIIFVVLYVLMNGWGLPRVRAALEARRQRIEGDVAKAAQMKNEAEAVIAAYERALAEARAQAQATVRDTIERLNAAAAERQRALAQALAAETTAAERRIAAAKQEAMAGLREVAVEAARAAALKIAGTELDPARARAAVDAVLRERA
jgi:F-type H+-transporting ATPase subunit b